MKNLDTLLGRYPGGYIAGEHLTLPDLQIFHELTNEFTNGRENFEAFPHIDAWFKKMIVIPEIKETHDEWVAKNIAMKAAMS